MKKRRFGLIRKFSIEVLIIGFCITAAVIVVGSWYYRKSITKNYNNSAYDIAKTAAGYFTSDELKEYADLTYRYNTGKSTDEEISQVTSSERYQTISKQLDMLRSSMKANDIYVCVFDMDVIDEYTEKSFNNGTWNPIYYITDSYQNEEKRLLFGEASPIHPDYREDIKKSFYSGVHANNYFVSEGKFGYNTSAVYPVVLDGVTVAFVGVEIPMKTLNQDVAGYVIRVILVAGIVAVLLQLLGIWALVKTMLNPIKMISHEAEHFIQNNTHISETLGTIHTNDEIQVLGDSILKMEIGINEYIDNLTKITAEKERIGAELDVATQIQADMLPSIFPAFPERHEFDIYATMTPAKEVGGDFYDFFLADDNHLVLVIADVSGKGVPAALFMMISKTLIKSSAQLGLSPKEVLQKVNNQLCENNEAEMFVTVWIGIMEISTGKMVCANAGHEYPAIKRKNGEYNLYKDRHGLVLAGMECSKYREYELQFKTGDYLFVYTDGVPEATNGEKQMYGTERMINVLNKHKDDDCSDILSIVHKDVNSFVGEAPQFDDLTMLCMEYKGPQDDNL